MQTTSGGDSCSQRGKHIDVVSFRVDVVLIVLLAICRVYADVVGVVAVACHILVDVLGVVVVAPVVFAVVLVVVVVVGRVVASGGWCRAPAHGLC